LVIGRVLPYLRPDIQVGDDRNTVDGHVKNALVRAGPMLFHKMQDDLVIAVGDREFIFHRVSITLRLV